MFHGWPSGHLGDAMYYAWWKPQNVETSSSWEEISDVKENQWCFTLHDVKATMHKEILLTTETLFLLLYTSICFL
jgi:hypothetical protein